MLDYYVADKTEPINGWVRTHTTDKITPELQDEEVILMGWVHSIRDIGKLKFVMLRDERGMIQVTVPKKKVTPEVFEKVGKLSVESAIAVKGKVVAAKQAQRGVEIIPIELKILNKAERIPIDVEEKVDIELDTRLDNRILDLRKPRVKAIFDVQSTLVKYMRRFLEDNNFIEIHTPKIVAEATEGGANLFEIKYFEKRAFLAQSPQFYKQLMVIAGFGRVFEIGPVFRAESHHTRKHVNEYTSFDFEMAWIRSDDDVMKMEENMVSYALAKVKEEVPSALEILGVDFEVPKTPFKRVKYVEAIDLLNSKGKEISVGDDFDPESERMLGRIFKEKYGSDFVFVTSYPAPLRPPYTMPDPENEEFTLSFDLLFKGMEVTTGGQRIHIYPLLAEKFKQKGLNPADFKFYMEPFKFGAPPHGGLGLGIERFTMQLLNIPNIRECALLPRDRERLTP